MTREEALALLKKYNKEPFHLQHAFTVEGVMRWYANELGHGGEADFWALVGLLHEYERERSAYPTFASFCPRIAAFFDGVAETQVNRIEAVLQQ